MQENIIWIISGKINERVDQFEDMLKENSTKIGTLSEALHPHRNDGTKERKWKSESSKWSCEEEDNWTGEHFEWWRKIQLQMVPLSEWSFRVLYGEHQGKWRRYAERWFLRLTLWQVRWMWQISSGATQVRRGKQLKTTIGWFISRTARDLTWRHAKGSDYLKRNGLRFKDDLTSFDKDARSRLWRAVEKARQEGQAYFSGAKTFVDGKELKV